MSTEENSNTSNSSVFTNTTDNTLVNTDNTDKVLKTGDDNPVFADQLADIKNAQGSPKYSTVSDALVALKSTQEHIKTLETENAEYRTNATSTTKIQEMIEGLKNNGINNGEYEQTSHNPQLDTSTIRDTTLNTIKEYELQRKLEENKKSVGNKLSEKFGATKAQEVYGNKARELGLSVGDLDSLAAKSPDAVLAYFSTTQQDNNLNINNTSSVNTSALLNQQKADNQITRFDNLMFGGKTSEITAAWREISAQVSKQYEIT